MKTSYPIQSISPATYFFLFLKVLKLSIEMVGAASEGLQNK